MAKIRNKSGQDLWVPALGREVPADGIAEVPDAEVYGFTCSTNWHPVDKPAQAAHDAAVKTQTAAPEDPPADE